MLTIGLTAQEIRVLQEFRRMSKETIDVAAITGLPVDVVRASAGRVDEDMFAREVARQQGRVVSTYDPRTRSDDPDPTQPRPDFADPFLAALKPALHAAMTQLLNVSKEEVSEVLSNFTSVVETQTSVGVGVDEFLRKVLVDALGEDD